MPCSPIIVSSRAQKLHRNRPLNTVDALGLDWWCLVHAECPDDDDGGGGGGAGGGGGGGGFGCDYYDPICFDWCDFLVCGNPFGGGGGGGGFTPGNETEASSGSSTPSLGLDSLFSLLPGLNCGGATTGSTFTTPDVQTSQTPCVPDIVYVSILEAGNDSKSGQSPHTKIALAQGNFKLVEQAEGQCVYNLDCPNGNSSYGCSEDTTAYYVGVPSNGVCSLYLITHELVLVTGSKKCYGVGTHEFSWQSQPCK